MNAARDRIGAADRERGDGVPSGDAFEQQIFPIGVRFLRQSAHQVIGFNAKIVEIANTGTCMRSCWAVNAVVARQIAKEMAPQLLQDSKLNGKLMQMANIELLLARPLPNAPARA